MSCPACDSEALMLLGQLGNLVHCRCRNCGAGATFKAEEIEQEDE